MTRAFVILLALLLVAPFASAQQHPAISASTALLTEEESRTSDRPSYYQAVPGTERFVLTPEGLAATRALAASKPPVPPVDHTDDAYTRPGPASITPPLLERGGPTFTVNGAGDSGDNNPGDGVCYTGFLITDGTLFANECTLRAAIQEANATAGSDPILIRFSIFAGPAGSNLGGGRWRIAPTAEYSSVLRANVTLDGETQAGASCGNLVAGVPHDLRVVIEGSGLGPGATPGGIRNGGSVSGFVVRGLVVQNFNFAFGIFLSSDDALVECNYVGVSVSGGSAAGNLSGIYSGGTVRNNLVSGNADSGIVARVLGDGGTTITRNLVGTDEDGNQPLGNGLGIFVAHSDVTVSTNLASANGTAGIVLGEDPLGFSGGERAVGAELTNNTVGLTRTRTDAALGNGVWGILVQDGASDNDIGLPGAGNFVAAHRFAYGIRIEDAGTDENRVRANTVGLDVAGNAAPNGGGILVAFDFPRGNVIGGPNPGDGNIIAGNTIAGDPPLGDHGIHLLRDLDTVVEGNRIGLNAAGAARPNYKAGVFLERSTNPIIRGNTISGNGGTGVVADVPFFRRSGPSPDTTQHRGGLTTTEALVEDNRIGTNVAGTAARPNGQSGIALIEAEDATVRGNTIAGNTDTGIFLSGGTSGHVFEDNFIGTNASGADLGNGLPGGAGRAGVYCADASDVRIGRNFSPNTIRFNDSDGIFIGENCQDIAVVGNVIRDNGGLAVDLAPNGPNTGEVPAITSAENDGSSSIIDYALSAEPNTTYELLFCRNTAPDPSGYGECQFPNALATVTTNGAGDASGTRTLNPNAYPAGSWVTANATIVEGALPGGYGPTSEFAEAVEVEDTSPVEPDFDLEATNTSPLSVAPGGQVSFDYSITNNTGAAASGDLFYTVTPSGLSGVVVSGPVQAGQTVKGSFVQQVPGNTPAGDYTYTLHIGQYPGTSVDAEAFAVTVAGAARDAGTEWVVVDAAPWAPAEPLSRSDEALPSEAALDGAYPNPFSQSATVPVALPEAQRVRLAVYDVLGREVAVLLDGEVEAGRHGVALDGSGLPSGVYLVRLVAGEEAQTQRITLVR